MDARSRSTTEALWLLMVAGFVLGGLVTVIALLLQQPVVLIAGIVLLAGGVYGMVARNGRR